MSRSSRVLGSLALILSAGIACTEADSPTEPDLSVVSQQSGAQARGFTVYTQNLFLGGDTGPLFSLDFGDPAALPEVIQATGAFYADVLASGIPERAAEFVDVIDRRRPEVVGLQEAVGYVEGSLNLGTFSFVPSAPGPDLLASVMAEIEARGLPYSIATLQPTTAIALPVGPPDATLTAPAIAVQDRVVMLKRDDVDAVATAQGQYAARLPLGPADVIRGWVSMTVDRRGTPHHFVVTHLETQGSTDPASGVPYFIRQVHDGQAQELQAMLAALDGVTVLMGDLNSDAEAEPGQPSHTDTYESLISGGFLDVWAEAPHPRWARGYTCCQVDSDEPRVPDERIDFVLVRGDLYSGDQGHHRGLFRASVVGTRRFDRTATGLWPSDHGGIVATVRRVKRIKPLRMH